MEVCIRDLPASPQRLQVYCKAQQDGPICAKVIQSVQQGWPDKHKIEPVLKHYWKVQGDLIVHGTSKGNPQETASRTPRDC